MLGLFETPKIATFAFLTSERFLKLASYDPGPKRSFGRSNYSVKKMKSTFIPL